MKRNVILAASILLLFSGGHSTASAQDNELQKFEAGVHFTSLSINSGLDTRSGQGLGGRFTYNLTDNLALEAEGNFFPNRNQFSSFRTGGRGTQGLFGIKVGKRYKRFGIFAKARPGFTSFSEGMFEFVPVTQTVDPSAQITIRTERLTHFTADIGGVVEFYPSRRIFTRIDAGDTIIHFGQMNFNSLSVGANNQYISTPIIALEQTTHNFQFSAGVGFRF
jgi:hypothetical protein